MNSKCHIKSGCSNYITGDINMFSYFTSTRGEVSSFGNKKDKYVKAKTISKSHNPTFEVF